MLLVIRAWRGGNVSLWRTQADGICFSRRLIVEEKMRKEKQTVCIFATALPDQSCHCKDFLSWPDHICKIALPRVFGNTQISKQHKIAHPSFPHLTYTHKDWDLIKQVLELLINSFLLMRFKPGGHSLKHYFPFPDWLVPLTAQILCGGVGRLKMTMCWWFIRAFLPPVWPAEGAEIGVTRVTRRSSRV